ncbi:MAG: hypothetical protein ACTSPI_17275, partial [Candidatus Heimdallarchaeaceae archaeon]
LAKNETQTILQLTTPTSGDRSTDPRFLSDGSICFLRDAGGNENFQIYCIENGKEKRISEDLEAKYISMFATKDYLYYSANILDKARFDIYRHRIPLSENKPERIYETKSGVPYSILTSDDRKLVILNAYGNIEHELLLLDLDKNEVRNLTSTITKESKNRWSPIGWLDSEYLLVATDYNSDLFSLGTLSINGEFKLIEELRQENEVSYVAYSENSPYTYITYNEDGYSTLYRAIISANEVKDIEKIELPMKGVIGAGDARSFTQALQLSSDGKYLAFTFTSPVSPSTIWIYDTKENKFWKAVEVKTAGISP